MSKRGQTALVLSGLALVVGFFLPWVDVGGIFTVSGFSMVWRAEGAGTTRLLLGLVPLVGALLAVAGLTGSRKTTGIALAAGGGILGYFIYSFTRAFFATTGIGLWLVLAAASVALVAGLASKKSA
jgi:hypothetical protein